MAPRFVFGSDDERERFMRGVDEEAAWLHGASMTAYLELERMTEPEED